MMINSTQYSYFRLAAYFDTGRLKYLNFVIVLVLYVSIICSNMILILLICVNRSLHEPLYIFLCSLFVNGLYGSTGLFPFILVQILSDVHTISVPLCFLQIFVIYSFGGVEFLNLTIMSYDRYLAICFPLQYNTLMSPRKISTLIFLAWLYPSLMYLGIVYLTSSLLLCGNVIPKVYCDNYNVVKLSCSDTTAINITELFAVFSIICAPFVVIIFSYTKILMICYSGSKKTRQKVMNTCTPQLASLINFTIGSSFEMVQSRFNMKRVPNLFRILISFYILTSPLLNPLVFGLNMSKIRLTWKACIFHKRCRK